MAEQEKKGITRLGFMSNIKTYIIELQSLLAGTTTTVDRGQIDKVVDKHVRENTLTYHNKFGYSDDRDSKPLTKENAIYIRFDTGLQTATKAILYGWFYRQRIEKNYTGVYWGTIKDFRDDVRDKTAFRMGSFTFDNWNDGYEFLEDIADNTIPEKWTYQYHKSGIGVLRNLNILSKNVETVFHLSINQRKLMN